MKGNRFFIFLVIVIVIVYPTRGPTLRDTELFFFSWPENFMKFMERDAEDRRKRRAAQEKKATSMLLPCHFNLLLGGGQVAVLSAGPVVFPV